MEIGSSSVEVEVDDDPAALYGDSDGGAEAASVDMALAMALPLSSPSPGPLSRGAPTSMNASAVYRWYDIEEGFHLKRKEESAIAKCKTCQQQGKVERKTLVRFSKSVTSNLWRHLKENHPEVYDKHAGEKKSVQMHQLVGAKKRARKKKNTPASAAAASGSDRPSGDAEGLADLNDDDPVPSTDAFLKLRTTTTPTAKKQRQMRRSDPFFDDYQLPSASGGTLTQHQPSRAQGGGGNGSSAPSASNGVVATSTFHPEKIREAIAYLCVVEMVPFDLCASHAFRNVLVECAGGGYMDDAVHHAAVFNVESASTYAKKLAADVKARVAVQMKMTDFAHLMLSEWTMTTTTTSSHSLAVTTAQDLDVGSSSVTRFLALFAVGLDHEFNAFRRCLHVLPVGRHDRGSSAAELLHDSDVKKALDRVVPCKYMPQVLAVDPPSHHYAPFCAAHKLASLESVTSLLQHIMLATINGVRVTDTFHLGNAVLTHHVGLWDRRLDGGEFIESPSALGDDVYALPEAEVPTSVLEELPAALTGHTLRDLMLKVMYLLAHLKQSRRSRTVLQNIALDELGTSRTVYERVFVAGLRETPVSLARIYRVLALAFDMMAALKQYFQTHKDGVSDLSKLVQLAALSPYEWSRIAHLKTILKPFADATEKLEAERSVIASLVIPSVFTLLGKLRDTRVVSSTAFSKKVAGALVATDDDADNELPEDIVALQDAAYANLSTSFGYLFVAPEADWSSAKRQTFHLLWAATLLDPRTRPFIIKGPLSPLELWDVVKLEAATIAGTKAKDDKENASELAEAAMALDDDSTQLDGSDGKTAGDLWDDLEANLTSCAQEEMLLSAAKSSLEMAKSTNLLEVEVSFFQEEPHISLRASPLEWWQSMRLKYPFLARLARYVLAIPLSVRVDENPVAADSGLVRRARAEMGLSDLCDLLAASMNLRTEKSSLFEASNKPMWSTV